MDEYSDPYDLKKQIQDTPELLGACAPATVQAIAEDDYSVPYEVKKLMKGKYTKSRFEYTAKLLFFFMSDERLYYASRLMVELWSYLL